MPRFGAATALYGFAIICRTTSQQFSDVPLPVNYPGISDRCFNALNNTVTCPSLLLDVSIDNPRLTDDQLSALCTSKCKSSLNSVRSSVARSCTGTNDTILFQDGQVPATYMVDSFLYTYALSCRKDQTSGKFCDNLLAEWANGTLTKQQSCSDCMLGVEQIQLNSPFGYDEEFASDFQSLTSSCSASAYSWTTPDSLPYTPTSRTATDPAATSQVCLGHYEVVAGDDCFTVSRAQSVATFALLDINVLDVFCKDPLAVGTSLCLPPTCKTYEMKDGDSCESILRANPKISFAQLRSFNPNINADCSNIDRFRGFEICLNSPSGTINDPALTTDLAVSTATTAAEKPTNAPDESNSKCGKWYIIQDGDFCDSISVNLGISLKDFYFLNPEINEKCTNLLLGLAYCIGAVGDIRTYSGYSTSAAFTLPPQTTQTPSPVSSVASNHVMPSIKPESMLPRAPDTLSDCSIYANAGNPHNQVSANFSSNRCSYVATDYSVTVRNLTTWNPSLDASECALQSGYSYCVRRTNETYETPSSVISNDALCDKPAGDPVDGTDDSCACFFNVYEYDSETETCEDIADYVGIDLSDVLAWNSWLAKSDCTSSLFANLEEGSARAVCIGTSSISTGPTPSTTSGTSASLPPRAGAISACTEYYDIKSGDDCSSIQDKFDIAFGSFYNWNPAIGGDCRGLWLEYSYCVAAPSIDSAEPAAPTRTGTLSDSKCKRYYTVQDGDGCYKIQQEFSVTLEELYTWNTDIGSACGNLQLGYALCVEA